MTRLSAWKKASAVFLLCAATAVASSAQTFTNLFSFDGADGSDPMGSLVQGASGDLYGTTYRGGPNSNDNCDGTCGTAFKITVTGSLLGSHFFCPQNNCTDGSNPYTGMILATDGNFYGTTEAGGNVCNGTYGCGTVFRISAKGRLTTLYRFCAEGFPVCIDGYAPFGQLAQGTDGNLYGTTPYGGGSKGGTVFKITLGGKLTPLHNFDGNGTDGVSPNAGLVEASDGRFYGTTSGGGTHNLGTIYRIRSGGALTIMHNFNGSDGILPQSALVQGTDGELYGTTHEGGVYNDGTVFKITLGGILTTLYSFCAQPNCTDGKYPDTNLVQGTDGNFYGTSGAGGANGGEFGTIFNITSTGALNTLHSFDGSDGTGRPSGLIQSTNGTFYGMGGGGTYLEGNVYSLDMGLGPFVTFVHAAGKIGQTGGILGQGFIGTTGVSFNGIPGSFTVVSDTFLNATVPNGATTGYVTVTTPSGTLTSNVPFHVIP
jgi:uncharacterized repeat protein (TIGR03803 family)